MPEVTELLGDDDADLAVVPEVVTNEQADGKEQPAELQNLQTPAPVRPALARVAEGASRGKVSERSTQRARLAQRSVEELPGELPRVSK